MNYKRLKIKVLIRIDHTNADVGSVELEDYVEMELTERRGRFCLYLNLSVLPFISIKQLSLVTIGTRCDFFILKWTNLYKIGIIKSFVVPIYQ